MNDNLREQFILMMTKCSKYNAASPSFCGLPVNELGILHIISESSDGNSQNGISLNMQRIQERLQISKPAISYNLNMLEKKEYIVREIDPKDRRRISVHVTQKGTDAWEDSIHQHEDMWNQLVEEFGESDMQALTQLLTRFFEVVDQMNADGKL